MDRFKFRAYIQKYNKLVDVYKFGIDGGTCQWVWHSNIYDTPDGKPVLDNWGSVDERFSNIINKTKLSDCILEQCTGLKDVNGNLIYEGDILKSNETILKVFWWSERGSFAFKEIKSKSVYTTSQQSIALCGFEVIGNIHENKDLLEK